MGIDGESMLTENVVACTYYSRIISIYVANIKPCAYTVGLQLNSQFSGCLDIFVEEHDGLHIAALVGSLLVCQADGMKQTLVSLVAGLDEQGNLCASNGWLLDNGNSRLLQLVTHER